MFTALLDGLERLPHAVFAMLLVIATFGGVLMACGLFTVLWTVVRTVARG